MNSPIGRRDLLIKSGLASLGLAAAHVAKAAEMCGFTPEQPEGPFYPVVDQADKNTDLTLVEGHNRRAKGEAIVVEGQVRGTDCRPIKGAMVEIWQACATGKYDHPEDPNPAALDRDFQYWGRTTTDANGMYKFTTILPGDYPAGDGWVRPSHIHFKVAAPSFPMLITQMYFEGNPLNTTDRILRRLAPDLRKLVVIPFVRPTPTSLRQGQFDIVMAKAGVAGATPELD